MTATTWRETFGFRPDQHVTRHRVAHYLEWFMRDTPAHDIHGRRALLAAHADAVREIEAADDRPACPSCGGSGKSTAADAPVGKPFPAKDRKHVRTPVRKVDCPACGGTGKAR
jgi:hypothetical protein